VSNERIQLGKPSPCAQELGKQGEEAAAGFLKDSGYKILNRNYKSKLGEIDIVAQDEDVIVFIEVKARHSDRFGLPQESVSRRKQGQISKAAVRFLKENNLLSRKARFDVISVSYTADAPRFNLIKNAFELDERFVY